MCTLEKTTESKTLGSLSVDLIYVGSPFHILTAGEGWGIFSFIVSSIQYTPRGGPLQMLLALTLNFLPASPKNSATGPTFGPF